jgi:hypothetical protein
MKGGKNNIKFVTKIMKFNEVGGHGILNESVGWWRNEESLLIYLKLGFPELVGWFK